MALMSASPHEQMVLVSSIQAMSRELFEVKEAFRYVGKAIHAPRGERGRARRVAGSTLYTESYPLAYCN